MVMKKESSPLKKTQTPRSSERLWIKKKLFWIVCVIITVFAVYLAWDYRGPLEIPLQPDNACGLPRSTYYCQAREVDGFNLMLSFLLMSSSPERPSMGCRA